MTHILTKLAALTQQKDGLLPCPNCFGTPWVCKSINDGVVVICHQCNIHTQHKEHTIPGYQSITEEMAVAAAIADWNDRPREAALIALVQETVGEIERLRCLLRDAKDVADRATFGIYEESAKQRYPELWQEIEHAVNPKDAKSC